MRILIVILPLLLAGCDAEAPRAVAAVTLKVGHYFQQGGRGRFCVHPGSLPQRAIFIAYVKEGMANCSASGTLQPNGKGLVLIPGGEGDCRIPVDRQADRLTLGPSPAACDYYCGPNLKLGGQSFDWVDTSTAEMMADPLFPDDLQC